MSNTLFTEKDNLLIARGKVINETSIKLPEEWEEIANPKTITVSLTPCGASQNIVVKTIDLKEVRLQSFSGIPIECFYLILAETK
jgi:hypothetical protein